MTPRRTVNIVCSKASAKVPCVPGVRVGFDYETQKIPWRCSFCGARVKVVA